MTPCHACMPEIERLKVERDRLCDDVDVLAAALNETMDKRSVAEAVVTRLTAEPTEDRLRIVLALSLLGHGPRKVELLACCELLDEVRLALLGATVEDLMQQRKDRE